MTYKILTFADNQGKFYYNQAYEILRTRQFLTYEATELLKKSIELEYDKAKVLMAQCILAKRDPYLAASPKERLSYLEIASDLDKDAAYQCGLAAAETGDFAVAGHSQPHRWKFFYNALLLGNHAAFTAILTAICQDKLIVTTDEFIHIFTSAAYSSKNLIVQKDSLFLLGGIMSGFYPSQWENLSQKVAKFDPKTAYQHLRRLIEIDEGEFSKRALEMYDHGRDRGIYPEPKVNWTHLIKRGTYVYKHYLSKKYLHIDSQITIDSISISRFNHGLALAFRNASYVPKVIDFYKQFGKTPKFRQYCQQLTSEQILDIQTALLFSFTGTESEISFSQNPQLYNQYNRSSAQNYVTFARQNNFPNEIINSYSELIQVIGNPNYLLPISVGSEEKHYLYYIMSLARDLDLMRCESLSKYQNSINIIIRPSTESFSNRNVELNNLFKQVTDSIMNTGDQLMCGFINGKMMPISCKHTSRFVEASTNPVKCWQMINENKNKPLTPTFFNGANNAAVVQHTSSMPSNSICILS